VFYSYLWLREDGTPYYVGKGTRNRVYEKHRVRRPSKEYIVMQEFEREEDAFFAEKFLIALYGRLDKGTGLLSNLTDGGEGVSGRLITEGTRQKLSDLHKGLKHTEEARQKIRNAKLGHVVTEETRRKMSAMHKGKTIASKGKPWSPARRAAQKAHNA
jgi:hypothetical protein